MKKLIVILYNIRSTYNVGAILRTCDGLGIDEIIFTGYTPFLDKGLPHEQAKLRKQIHKTALGAEDSLAWRRIMTYMPLFKVVAHKVCRFLHSSRELARSTLLRRIIMPPTLRSFWAKKCMAFRQKSSPTATNCSKFLCVAKKNLSMSPSLALSLSGNYAKLA